MTSSQKSISEAQVGDKLVYVNLGNGWGIPTRSEVTVTKRTDKTIDVDQFRGVRFGFDAWGGISREFKTSSNPYPNTRTRLLWPDDESIAQWEAAETLRDLKGRALQAVDVLKARQTVDAITDAIDALNDYRDALGGLS